MTHTSLFSRRAWSGIAACALGARSAKACKAPEGVSMSQGSSTLVDIDLGGMVSQIDSSYEHTCALLEDGTVRCWGFGAAGRLGYGGTSNIGEHPSGQRWHLEAQRA